MLDAVYSLNDHAWLPLNNSHKDLTIRLVVAFTCSLSMVGALLIILSYICLKSIRTKTRQIIAHLSVADFGAACANFIGATVYFDPYIHNCKNSGNNTYPGIPCGVVENLCTAQAFFAGYFTLASVLWTLSLSVYIHCLVVHSGLRTHTMVVYFSYFFCWGMPLVITVWLVTTDRLGYAPYGGSGWCSLKFDNHGFWSDDVYVLVFANDLWIYLTFFLVTVLYFSTHCYIRSQLRDSSLIFLSARGSLSALHSADTKFLFIPFAFLLLRIWSIIMVFLMVYLHVDPPHVLYRILIYATGIGDSGQGFVNALLFCVLTPKVRSKLLCCCRDRNRSCHCCQRKTDMDHSLSSPASTTSFPSEAQPCVNTFVDQKSTVT